jgi:hypothetical protein
MNAKACEASAVQLPHIACCQRYTWMGLLPGSRDAHCLFLPGVQGQAEAPHTLSNSGSG